MKAKTFEVNEFNAVIDGPHCKDICGGLVDHGGANGLCRWIRIGLNFDYNYLKYERACKAAAEMVAYLKNQGGQNAKDKNQK